MQKQNFNIKKLHKASVSKSSDSMGSDNIKSK